MAEYVEVQSGKHSDRAGAGQGIRAARKDRATLLIARLAATSLSLR